MKTKATRKAEQRGLRAWASGTGSPAASVLAWAGDSAPLEVSTESVLAARHLVGAVDEARVLRVAEHVEALARLHAKSVTRARAKRSHG